MDTHEPAGETKWLFPDLGEESPARSDSEVFVLTAGGMCIRGHWDAKNPFYIAWARFPKRDRTKEALVAEARSRGAQALQSTQAGDNHHGRPIPSTYHSQGHTT